MVDRLDADAIPQQVCGNSYVALHKVVAKALFRWAGRQAGRHHESCSGVQLGSGRSEQHVGVARLQSAWEWPGL